MGESVLGPIYGPFPWPGEWEKARERAGHPQLADGARSRLTPAEWAAANDHHKRWEKWHERQAAKDRAAERALLPHPNWDARRKGCFVAVPVKPTFKHPAWERSTECCRVPAVAYDTTDKRVTGYLYGACAQHLAQALADSPEREWRWADGRQLDRTTVDDELTLLVLGGLGPRRRRH